LKKKQKSMGKALSIFACETKTKVNTFAETLEKLEKLSEDGDIVKNMMFGTIDRVCSVNQDEVDLLFKQTEEEVAFDLTSQLPNVPKRVL
tara:strand:+ start:85 stop:354 length:270 start_codon:yes stop_codon:yes gene_type:complete